MQSLAEYILTLEQLNLKHNTREEVMSLLTTRLVSDTGYVLVSLASCTMVPTILGYVGAIRGSRVLLAMVCKTSYGGVQVLLT